MLGALLRSWRWWKRAVSLFTSSHPISVYAKLVIVAVLIFGEPAIMEKYGIHEPIIAVREHFDNPSDQSGEDLANSDRPTQDQSIYDTARRLWDTVWK